MLALATGVRGAPPIPAGHDAAEGHQSAMCCAGRTNAVAVLITLEFTCVFRLPHHIIHQVEGFHQRLLASRGRLSLSASQRGRVDRGNFALGCIWMTGCE